MSLKVCSQQCDQCLFSKTKIVSEARKRQILQECAAADDYFTCHKTDDAVCAGFYKRFDSQTIQVAQRLDVVEFV